MVAAMLTALDHVILAVRDLEGSSADYQRLLGLAPSWTGTHPEWGTANVLFRIDNTYLELLSPAGEGPVGRLLGDWIDAHGEGLVGMAFATDDIEACSATLAERGICSGSVEEGQGRDIASGEERRWRRTTLPPDRTRGIVIFPIQHDSPDDVLPAAKPTGDAMASVYALDHVVVQTTDANAAKALYGDTLGLRLALDKEFPDWGVRLMFFRVGGVTVEVAAALSGVETGKALPGASATATEDRLYGMSWRVRSVDGTRERLAAAGVDVSEIRVGRRPGTRVFTVRSQTRGVPTLMIEVEDGSPTAGTKGNKE